MHLTWPESSERHPLEPDSAKVVGQPQRVPRRRSPSPERALGRAARTGGIARREDLVQYGETFPVRDRRDLSQTRNERRDLAASMDVSAAVREHSCNADHEHGFGFVEHNN